MLPSRRSDPSLKSTNRPPSLSVHPSSRNTSRPGSSATQRLLSSLSVRSASRASVRPQSRFSERTHSRHARSRLIPLCQTLVSKIAGLRDENTEQEPDGESFPEAVEHMVKALETSTINKAAAGVDMSVIDSRISGYVIHFHQFSRI
jgi:gamma-tubulin complex component 5